MLSCTITFKRTNKTNCGENEDFFSTVLRKLTSEIYPSVISNAYLKPNPKCPYYSIGRYITAKNEIITDEFDLIINPCDYVNTTTQEETVNSEYVINLFCGDTRKATPVNIVVNYLRTPKKVYLQEEDLYGEDRTEQVEFPEYVCYEIINEFVKLLLENTADPRLSTNVPINQSIIGEISAD